MEDTSFDSVTEYDEGEYTEEYFTEEEEEEEESDCYVGLSSSDSSEDSYDSSEDTYYG